MPRVCGTCDRCPVRKPCHAKAAQGAKVYLLAEPKVRPVNRVAKAKDHAISHIMGEGREENAVPVGHAPGDIE